MTLHVLVWAPAGADGVLIKPTGPPPVQPWRVLCYVEPLAALGVELRGLPLVVDEPALYSDGLEAVRAAVEWCDLILWRPSEPDWLCKQCAYTAPREALARHHAARTGHEPFPSDLVLRRFWSDCGPGRAQVGVMVDVDHWIAPDSLWWVPAPIRDQVQGWRHPIASADLVSASTPRLSRHLARFNPNVRVVRNSIDVASYVPSEPRRKGRARLVWYAAGGVTDRLSDWIGPAQAAAKDHHDRLKSVFVGANPNRPEDGATLRAAGFDEVRPAVDFRVWPREFANSFPDVGISPLRPSPYQACRGPNHWLEFAALGCPCVVQGWRGSGPFPYDFVRPGIDGLLARTRIEWSEAVGRLARSPQLRADIGGAARERVIRDYNPRVRAAEMADAYRWAAERAGIGRRGRPGSGRLPERVLGPTTTFG
jgi:Glycosyl transferases group 1